MHSKANSRLISGLASFLVHLTLLLLLAIWTIAAGGKSNGLALWSDGTSNDSAELDTVNLPEDAIDDAMDMNAELLSDAALLKPNTLDTTTVSPEITPPIKETGPLVESLTEALQTSNSSLSGKSNGFVEASLKGRSKANRGPTAMNNGATPESEAAVEAALEYLSRHQANDGSWSARFDMEPCNDNCTHSCQGSDPYNIGMTGLALLCFLGAGHTMQEGDYTEQVRKGVYYLVQNLRRSDRGGYWRGTEASAQMYEHGIATLALCEALQMSDANELKETCKQAIDFIVYAQHDDGGWDYHPKGPGDLSIVGWQVMALKSAMSAGIELPQKTIRDVDIFLKRNMGGEFKFRYRRDDPSLSMTSVGILIRIYRGWSRTDPSIIKAMSYMAKAGPSKNDMYFNYYGSQCFFQYGQPYWKNWNDMMREYLISTQSRDPHMAGSWWFDGNHSNLVGGRLYVTCMACLTLEVYYRYLPVYADANEEFKL